MAQNNLNTYPYYDDFDEDKNFAKILFVPGRSIQARELTQLQTILQEQIARHGRHMFKNGTMIIPGHIFYDNKTDFVKLAAKNGEGVLTNSFIDGLIGLTVKGETSGVVGMVTHVVQGTASNPPTLYVRYTAAGENSQSTKFAANETLTVLDLVNTSVIVESSTTSTGKGTLCHINDGVYFINGYFVKVQKQTIVLSLYTTTPSVKVGLQYKESIVTERDDETLYDNALGFSNFTAPGAHRLKIELELVTKNFNFDVSEAEEESDTELKFIDLLQVRSGNILYKINQTKYAEFERLLARRTADESGDYVVKDFKLQMREFRSNIRGQWVAGTVYLRGDVVTNSGKSYIARTEGVSGSTAPTHVNGIKSDGSVLWVQTSTISNNGGVNVLSNTASLVENLAATEKLAAVLSDGKAYINGFEVDKIGSSTIEIAKARDSVFVNASQILAPRGSYVQATTTNIPNISQLEQLEIRDATNTKIGTCRVRNIKKTTADGVSPVVCNVYIFDVRMNAGKNFSLQAKSLYSVSFQANITKQKLRIGGTANVLSGSLNTLNGLNSNFSLELQVGAVIYANIGDTPTTHTVLTIPNDVTATVSPNMVAANGITVDLEYVDLVETGANITQLPNEFIKSLRDPEGGLSIDTQYVVSKYVTDISNGVYSAVSGEAFQQTGHILSSAGSYTVAPDGSSITFSGVTGTISGILLVKRKNQSAKEKKKTLSSKTVYLFSTGVYDGPNAATATLLTAASRVGTSRIISIAEADAIKITSVTRSGDANPAATVYNSTNEVDITQKFSLLTGQTDEYYGTSSISTSEIPNRSLRITFDYFEHSTGDYFSVDSYSDVNYEDIPAYRATNGTVYQLRDCLDFRPRMNDAGTGFTGTGAIVGAPVIDTEYITFDYSYYIPRKDKIVIDTKGVVSVVSGESSINPVSPSVQPETLDIFDIELKPYTVSTSSQHVIPTRINHRRYTMKDIGNLDSRLTNVEEYVALTLEEKATADLKIVDKYGLDRFKNGFFVDGFKDFNVADVAAADIRCSIDPVNELVRPNIIKKDIRLIEREGTSAAFRRANNYRTTSNIASLDYTEVPLISQRIASRGEFINPFNVVVFEGMTQIYPNTDTWTEIEETFDSTAADAARSRIGERWRIGATRWLVTWAGATRTTVGRTFFSRNMSNTAGSNTRISTEIERVRSISGVDTRSELSRSDLFKNTVRLIRGRKVVVTVSGLMPYAEINTYINKELVDANTTALQMLTLTSSNGTFLGFRDGDIETDRESARTVRESWTDPTLRLVGSQNDNVMQYGEVLSIRNASNVEIATALCVKHGLIRIGSTDVNMLRVFNFIGTMSGATLVVGASSGATAVINAGSLSSQARNADSLGNFYAVVDIPHRRFNTGVLDFEFMNSSTYDLRNSTCHAIGEYHASGDIQRNFYTETVVGFSTVDTWNNTGRVRTDVIEPAPQWEGGGDGGGGGDPLAQTFTLPVEARNGAMVTSVDIFFHTKAINETLPVIVLICETDNGYPSRRVVRNAACTLEASAIIADSTKLIATRARFIAPAYLRPGVEYCVKVISNSDKYKIWISRMGEQRVDVPTSIVTTQPSLGSLFKSQNNSTWSAEQLEDMTFVLNRAKFDISRSGLITVVNSNLTPEFLPPDPIGVVNGSTVARVNHPSHGFINGQRITLSGTGGYDGTYLVTNAREGYYYITLGAAATVTDNVGGTTVSATNNFRYDGVVIAIDNFTPNATTVNSTFGGVIGDAVETVSAPVALNTEIYGVVSRYVMNADNEFYSINKQKSLRATLGLSSTDDYVSPLIVFDSMAAQLIANSVDNPASIVNVTNSSDIETIVTGNIAFDADNNAFTVTDNISAFIAGAYLTISGAGVGGDISTPAKILRVDASENKVYVDFDITINSTIGDDEADAVVKQYTAFVDELSQDEGSAAAKYITQQIRLDSVSTALRIMFAANIQNNADIDLYYRTGMNDISKVYWTKVTTSYKKSVDASEYFDQEYDLDNLVGFNTYQIKIVMRTTNKAIVPKIKSLRGIALA